MASYVKFHDTIRAICEGEHNFATSGGDTLKIYLTNATPSASDDADKADLAEIAAGNGYTSGGQDTTNTGSESAGTYTVAMTDVIWTASGGAIAQFRYVVCYNDDHASDGLICHWDYGSAVDVADGETFTTDFGANTFTIA